MSDRLDHGNVDGCECAGPVNFCVGHCGTRLEYYSN